MRPSPSLNDTNRGPLTGGHMSSICNLRLELSESSKTFGQVDILSSMLGSAHNNRDDWETMSKQRKSKKHQWCLTAKSLCKNKMMSRIKTRHTSMWMQKSDFFFFTLMINHDHDIRWLSHLSLLPQTAFLAFAGTEIWLSFLFFFPSSFLLLAGHLLRARPPTLEHLMPAFLPNCLPAVFPLNSPLR